MALIAFPLAGIGLGYALNGFLDNQGEIVGSSQPIIRKEIVRHKRSRSYYAYTELQRDPGGQGIRSPVEAEIRISRAEYDSIQPHQSRIILVTKPGWLGQEWLVSYRIE